MWSFVGALRESYLRFLAKVGGEFEGDHVTSVIAHYDDGVDGVKLDVS